ncbi:MAG TPA: NapC/NirT family cytochrome c [Pseudolabrys sp.]|jgi:nitrate/TMAO reductase-like tetraheme cytochrome c subunit|nr:NapC/NirT family cytochrome c [Pseudolabrys sp.]
MRINRGLLFAGAIGFVLGAGAIITSIAFNHYTSTTEFCTSCHSMTFQLADPHFQKSVHWSNSKGVRPSCGDCHIPTTNWFIETYTHATSGIRDIIAELTHNYNDPKLWEARRRELAPETVAHMRAQDSVTCRSCHDASAIKPTTEDGRVAHATLKGGGVTCVDCHTNIVHAPTSATN